MFQSNWLVSDKIGIYPTSGDPVLKKTMAVHRASITIRSIKNQYLSRLWSKRIRDIILPPALRIVLLRAGVAAEIDPVLVPRFIRFYSKNQVMWPSARFPSARGHGAL